MLAAKLLFDELLQAAGGDGVRYDQLAGSIFQHDSGSKSHKTVTVDFLTLGINSTAAVNVSVKDNAEVSTKGLYSLANGSHGFCVLRIRDMVGEGSVRLKELAASYVSAESLQHICCIEAAYAVAGIHNKFEALEGMMIVVLVIDLLLDEFTEIACIISHILVYDDVSAAANIGLIAVLSILKDSGDISALQSALTGKELEAVSVIGVMACGYLNSAVAAKLHGGHKHCRGRTECAVYHAGACSDKSVFRYLCDPGTGDP